MKNWSFAKGISESEAIARRKEHDEEKKMTWSLVAKVEYMVVGKVVKLVVEVGSLVFHGGKEEEEDDGDGVVVVGMVEEMEEKKVEELVEMVVEMEGEGGGWRWPAKEARGCHFVGCMLAGNKGGEEEIKKERERKWGLYKGMEMNIIMLPFPSY